MGCTVRALAVNHIVQHFQAKVEASCLKAQVVCFDRECCVLYKNVMDELLRPEVGDVVMSGAQNDTQEWVVHLRDKDSEEKLVTRFRNLLDHLNLSSSSSIC